MNRVRGFLLVMTVISSAAIGCGDDDKDSGGDSSKCDDAVKILEACDQDTDDIKECGKEEQAFSDCVIAHPKGACSEDFASKEAQDFITCATKQ